MDHPLNHGYKHEGGIILLQNMLTAHFIPDYKSYTKNDEHSWLEKIKAQVPNFSPANEGRIIFFGPGIMPSGSGPEGIYSLSVDMNIACVHVLYQKSCNVLEQHISSILRYLVITMNATNRSVEVDYLRLFLE